MQLLSVLLFFCHTLVVISSQLKFWGIFIPTFPDISAYNFGPIILITLFTHVPYIKPIKSKFILINILLTLHFTKMSWKFWRYLFSFFLNVTYLWRSAASSNYSFIFPQTISFMSIWTLTRISLLLTIDSIMWYKIHLPPWLIRAIFQYKCFLIKELNQSQTGRPEFTWINAIYNGK